MYARAPDAGGLGLKISRRTLLSPGAFEETSLTTPIPYLIMHLRMQQVPTQVPKTPSLPRFLTQVGTTEAWKSPGRILRFMHTLFSVITRFLLSSISHALSSHPGLGKVSSSSRELMPFRAFEQRVHFLRNSHFASSYCPHKLIFQRTNPHSLPSFSFQNLGR